MTAIEIQGLEKRYRVGFWRKREKWGLKPLHLQVNAGEVFGYLGPNGAGKTTTLKLLMGLVFPTAGTATLLGRPFDDPQVKAEIGFLPEQPYFYDNLTARELLHYFAQLSGIAAGDRRAHATRALERVGMSGEADKQLRKFSKGMLQRVGIAQAILHDPKLIFLDEPMSGLDPVGRREVRDLIAQLRSEGKTVFFSTHILSDAEALCDRVAVIHQGELKGVRTVAELASRAGSRYELVWIGEGAIAKLRELGGECHATGDTVRATLASERLDAALDALRSSRARLISVTPVRNTLEEFFLSHVSAAEGQR